MPGIVKATDRFQRAAYFMGVLPEPEGEREAVTRVLAIIRNCSVPFGAPYGDFGIYNTEYRKVMNLLPATAITSNSPPAAMWCGSTSTDLTWSPVHL